MRISSSDNCRKVPIHDQDNTCNPPIFDLDNIANYTANDDKRNCSQSYFIKNMANEPESNHSKLN